MRNDPSDDGPTRPPTAASASGSGDAPPRRLTKTEPESPCFQAGDEWPPAVTHKQTRN
jgi:hypothetical protein